MLRKRKMSDWKAIRVKQAGLTSVGPVGGSRKRSSGKIVSPWQFDRWSFDPQNLAVVSSPSLKRSSDSFHGEMGLEAISGRNPFAGLSIVKLGTVLFTVFSVFMAGILLSLLLGS